MQQQRTHNDGREKQHNDGRDKKAHDPMLASNLSEQTGAVAEDLKELGQRTKQAARDRINMAGDMATGLYEQGLDKASELYDQGRKKARQLGTQVEKHVQQRPFQTMLIVAGAATLLGFLMSRRYRSNH